MMAFPAKLGSLTDELIEVITSTTAQVGFTYSLVETSNIPADG